MPDNASARQEQEHVDRLTSAQRAYDKLFPGAKLPNFAVTEHADELARSSLDFRRYIAEITLADSWERPGLDYRSKSLITMAILVALGGQDDELGRHFNAALNLGITASEIVELLLHASAYCGVPRAHTAFTQFNDVLDSRPAV